jgi:hypothetical protein
MACRGVRNHAIGPEIWVKFPCAVAWLYFFNRLLELSWTTSHVGEHAMFGLVYRQIFVLMLKGIVKFVSSTISSFWLSTHVSDIYRSVVEQLIEM